MSETVRAVWFDGHGKTKGPAEVYVSRAFDGAPPHGPVGPVYLSVQVGQRQIDLKINADDWDRLDKAARSGRGGVV